MARSRIITRFRPWLLATWLPADRPGELLIGALYVDLSSFLGNGWA